MSEENPKKRTAETEAAGNPPPKRSRSMLDMAGLTEKERKAITSFLTDVKVGDVAQTKAASQVIAIKATDTMQHALKVMQENKISSVPVRFEPKALEEYLKAAAMSADSPEAFLGFIDTLDVMFFLAETYAKNKKEHDHLFEPKKLAHVFETPCSVYINESGRDPFLAIASTDSLAKAMEGLFKWGVHRVPITVDAAVTGTVSQSDVINFCFKNIDKLEPLASRTLLDLNLVSTKHLSSHEAKKSEEEEQHEREGPRKLISVLDNATMIEALQQMMSLQVGAIAICDIKGKVVGDFSANDLLYMSNKTLFELESKLMDVLIYHDVMNEPVRVTAKSTLRQVLALLVENKATHAFIIDETTERGIGCVTFTDFIRALVTEFIDIDDK